MPAPSANAVTAEPAGPFLCHQCARACRRRARYLIQRKIVPDPAAAFFWLVSRAAGLVEQLPLLAASEDLRDLEERQAAALEALMAGQPISVELVTEPAGPDQYDEQTTHTVAIEPLSHNATPPPPGIGRHRKHDAPTSEAAA
ncbi:hypothetical protein [Streptomyces sp. NPDC057579]|uniref:hypothetical protein n=1 Tax=Streptomyces sp. NPDC057579 TaxID=3346172 RepID=UPI00369080DD